MNHDRRYLWLDLARGVSALIVCAGHLRGSIAVPYAEIAAPSLFETAFYGVTSLGYAAVMVFFVLSGFFVGGSIIGRAGAFRFDAYLAARLSRLWVVLIPALVLTYAADCISREHEPGLYYWAIAETPLVFLGNVLFLQELLVEPFGSNLALWSLANEFWYYVAFPLFAIACGFAGRGRPAWARMLCALAGFAVFAFMNTRMRLGFFTWGAGVAVFLLAARSGGRPLPRWLLAVLSVTGSITLLGALAYQRARGEDAWPHLPIEWVIGGGFLTLCYVLTRLPPPGAESAIARLARGLSEFSYSLYLTHTPLVVLLAATVYRTRKLSMGPLGFLEYAFWLCALLAVGALFWWLFERHTARVRAFVIRKLPAR